MKTVQIYKTDSDLAKGAADKIEVIAAEAIRSNGKFSISLSGGSTPRKAYEQLVSANLDWDKTFVYWGDERTVPFYDHNSNYKMANDTLLSKVTIPDRNIYRWKTELDPESAATDYAFQLSKNFDSEMPKFDVVLLGLGEDGHTASLFPETEALKAVETSAVANKLKDSDEYRLTLTFPAINNAENIIFLVTGAEKSVVVAKVLENPTNEKCYPAEFVEQASGKIIWMLDEPAAKELKQI